jgi:peptidoglycan/LPS O-acetylase OafA/YrhL
VSSLVTCTPATPNSSLTESNRLDALDGLRGIAAVLVVIYHFTARWSAQENGESLYPYGDHLLEALPFLNLLGLYGVSLFFLISGFVIMMTLERSSGIADFAVRRASRLWPTMLVCATLTTLLISVSGIHLRFQSISHWEIQPLEYLSSIIFVDPAFTGTLLDIDGLQWVDGVYWTLWIEVRFYALVALVYWLTSGGQRFIWAWLLIQTCSVIILAMIELTRLEPRWILILIFQPHQLYWFTLGMCGFLYWKGQMSTPMVAMAIMSVVVLASDGASASTLAANALPLSRILLNIAVVATFALFLVRSPVMSLFAHRWAIALGLASYTLYMFHERVGVIGMTAMSDIGIPPVMILPLMLAASIATALLLHRFMEKPSKALMLSAGMPAAKYLEKKWPVLAFHRNANERV